MKLALREIRFVAIGRLEVEFLDRSTDKMVLAEFHFREEDGRIVVTGSEPDGSAVVRGNRGGCTLRPPCRRRLRRRCVAGSDMGSLTCWRRG